MPHQPSQPRSPRRSRTPRPETRRNETILGERSGKPIVYLRREDGGYTVSTQSVARLLARARSAYELENEITERWLPTR